MDLRERLGYDWWQANPSAEKALPIILSGIFEDGQECAWMAMRSYETEDMFLATEEYYRQRYPNLFDQLGALTAARASTPEVLEDSEQVMQHYYRGAVIAVRALEASMPEDYFRDVSLQYVNHLEQLDMIDLETWLLAMRASTVKQTEQLRGFIEANYLWLNEPNYLKTAMHIGAQFAYIMMTHNRQCIEREQEISWTAHAESSYSNWIEYNRPV